jgi:hypothetical protein
MRDASIAGRYATARLCARNKRSTFSEPFDKIPQAAGHIEPATS